MWVHRFPGVFWAAPEPVPFTPRALQAFNRDHFFFRYEPGHGDIVVDVGAGFGSEVLSCSKLVGTAGTVVAIEAEPATFRCLQRTCEKNGLTNVVLIHAAVTDAPGLVRMTESADYVTNEIVRGANSGAVVPAITL